MKKLLGWAAGVLAVSALAAPVWARDDDYRRRGGYGRDGRDSTFGVGYDRGYYEGARDGARDGRGHRGFNLYHDRTYRDADQGYRSSFGPRRIYSQGFRQGYEQGYRRGYTTRREAHGRYDDRYRGDDRVIYEDPRRRW
jgi:hypothetical protein